MIRLDALQLSTARVFDCIYSNKVLHHFSVDEFSRSVSRQEDLLTGDGQVLHSFWRGEGQEEHLGLRFVYQTEESLRVILSEVFDITDLSEDKYASERCNGFDSNATAAGLY